MELGVWIKLDKIVLFFVRFIMNKSGYFNQEEY